jgi:dihydrofolate reductase
LSRIVVIEYVSLDGVLQGPGHAEEDREGGFEHGGWTGPLLAEHARYLGPQFQAAGGFLLGRVTFEIWASYWPTVTDEHDEIARALNGRPKYVASTTLEEPAWPGTAVIRDVRAEVTELRRAPGRPLLVMGSSALVHALTAHGLVDEYQLLLHPIVLGTGKQLFAQPGPCVELRHLETTTTAGGLVVLRYEPAECPR